MERKSKGKEMAEWMDANVYSQRDLASAIGSCQKTISNYINGVTDPSSRIWQRFIAFRQVIADRNRRLRRSEEDAAAPKWGGL